MPSANLLAVLNQLAHSYQELLEYVATLPNREPLVHYISEERLTLEQ